MHTRYPISLAAIVLVLLLSGPVPGLNAQEVTSEPDSSATIARGAELFSRNCQRCHNPRGPAEWDDREWVVIMQHMEMRANITRDRIESIRAFLLASNEAARSPGRARGLTAGMDPAEITDGMLAEGREVFAGRGGCAACHGADLDGGPIAPSLRDDVWRTGDGSLADILEIIRNGVEGTAMVPYPAGIDDEMARAVAAYVWSVSQGRTGG